MITPNVIKAQKAAGGGMPEVFRLRAFRMTSPLSKAAAKTVQSFPLAQK